MSVFIGKIIAGPFDVKEDIQQSVALTKDQQKQAEGNVLWAYNVLHPNGTIIRNVQWLRTKGFTILPKPYSTVAVNYEYGRLGQIIALLEDPDANASPRSKLAKDGMFSPGEIQLESDGGSFLYLSNDGSVTLSSGTNLESVEVIQDEGVYIQGSETEMANIIDKSEPKVDLGGDVNTVISSMKVNRDDSITVSMRDILTKQLMSQLKLTPLKGTTIKSYIAGVEKSKVELDLLGTITATNNIGTVKIDPLGKITAGNQVGAIEIDVTGNIKLSGIDLKVSGVSLIQWLNNHFHIGNLGAPTSPPTVPVIMTP